MEVWVPQVSKQKLDREVEGKMWELVDEMVSGFGGSQDVRVFLNGVMTQTERVMVAKRLMTWKMYLSGEKVTKIAQQLKMSRTTVYELIDQLSRDVSLKELVARNLRSDGESTENNGAVGIGKVFGKLWR